MVSGVKYIKEVLFLCMATEPAASAKNESEIIQSVEYNGVPYERQEDSVTFASMATQELKNELLRNTIAERDALHQAIHEKGVLRAHLRRWLTHDDTPEYESPKKMAATGNFSEERFKALRTERNKFIGMLAKLIKEVDEFEKMDFIKYNDTTYVRRVFAFCWYEKLGVEGCMLAWQKADKERNDLLLAVNEAWIQEEKLKSSVASPKAKREAKNKDISSDFINGTWFTSHKIEDGILPFKKLIDERDDLYEELRRTCQSMLFFDDTLDIELSNTLKNPRKPPPAATDGVVKDSSPVHQVVGRTPAAEMGAASGPVASIPAAPGVHVTGSGGSQAAAGAADTPEVDLQAQFKGMSVEQLQNMVLVKERAIQGMRKANTEYKSCFHDHENPDFTLLTAIQEVVQFENDVCGVMGVDPNDVLPEIEKMQNDSVNYHDAYHQIQKLGRAVGFKIDTKMEDVFHATNAKLVKFKAICDALGCDEHNYDDVITKLKGEKKEFEHAIDTVLLPVQFKPVQGQAPMAVLDKVTALSAIIQSINTAIPTNFIEEAPTLIGALRGSSGDGGDKTTETRLMKEAEALTGLLQTAQHLNIDNQRVISDLQTQIDDLRLKLTEIEHDFQTTKDELSKATISDGPIQLNNRLTWLLGQLHMLMQTEFSSKCDRDQSVLVLKIVDTICAAFHDMGRLKSVNELMKGVFTCLQLQIRRPDIMNDVKKAMVGYDIAKAKHAAHTEHRSDEDDVDEKFHDTMRKLENVVQRSRERVGEETQPPASDTIAGSGGLIPFNWSDSDEQAAARTGGRSGSERTAAAESKNAHIECVNAWLQDLSQVFERPSTS